MHSNHFGNLFLAINLKTDLPELLLLCNECKPRNGTNFVYKTKISMDFISLFASDILEIPS